MQRGFDADGDEVGVKRKWSDEGFGWAEQIPSIPVVFVCEALRRRARSWKAEESRPTGNRIGRPGRCHVVVGCSILRASHALLTLHNNPPEIPLAQRMKP